MSQRQKGLLYGGCAVRRRRRSYKFTDKHHTKRGIAACIIGAVVLLTLGGLFYYSYKAAGQGGPIIGVAGFFCLLASVFGLILALMGMKEEDVFYITSYVGVVVDGLLVIAWIIFYVLGM